MKAKTSSEYIRLALAAVRRENKAIQRQLRKNIPEFKRISSTAQDAETRRIARIYLNEAKKCMAD